MVAVGDGAVIRVDEIDQFGKIQGKLAVGFDRADIVRPLVIVAAEARVEAVPLDHNHVVSADEVGDVITAVIRAGIVIAVGRIVHRLVIALTPAVEPINDRVALGGRVVIRRQEDPEIAGFLKNLAELDAVLNHGLRTENRNRRQQRCEHTEIHLNMLTPRGRYPWRASVRKKAL